MNFLEAWDLAIKDGLYGLHQHDQWLTPVMHFMSALGSMQVLAVIGVETLVFFILIGRWRVGVCLAAAALAGYGIDYQIKAWVNRPRPDLVWVEPQDRQTSPSFPSSAALLAMTVYGGLAVSLAADMETRRKKAIFLAVGFLIPLLIGFSRLYLGVQYLSDVVGGFCAGLGCVFLFRWIAQQWERLNQAKPAVNKSTGAYQAAHAPRNLEQMQRSEGEQV